MQHPVHPDDERLAALAGDDPEVAADAALRAHVDACDRCTDVVRDLASLRSALSELPDLVPSRPLQLLPPVPEAKAPARSGWLRRLAAPAMAAGFVLVVVGAVGSSGLSVGQPASAEAPGELTGDVESEDSTSPVPGVVAPTTRSASGASGGPLLGGESSGLDGASPRANRSSDQETASSPSAEAAPPANGGESEGDGLFAPTDPRLPWLVVLALGVGLLLAGIYLRFVQQPRAG